MSLAWRVYRVVAPCLGALAPAARIFASGRERPLWGERLGHSGFDGVCHAWIHAASLGEAGAVPPLVSRLEALQPGARLFLTATTGAGRERLGALQRPVALAPIDSPQAVRRFLAGVRPRRLFVVETELWPHWLLHARRVGLPVAVVSARLAERSVGRYRRLGAEFRELVGGIAAVLCQSAEDARRWLALGARPERTEVVGNLKNDALPRPAPDRAAARRALGLDAGRPLLTLGSVRPGEVRALASAWAALPASVREEWQVAAVARHPRASGELRGEAAEAGQAIALDGLPRAGAWRWDDRPGVLPAYYAAADAAFVGGSLLRRYAGHNPLEPAACGAAVIVGPHHASQLPAMRALEREGAVWIAPPGEPLARALAALLGDAAERGRRAARGLAAVERERGATGRAVALLAGWGLWPAE